MQKQKSFKTVAASLEEGAVVTNQEQSQLLHSSAPDHVPDPWAWFQPAVLAALPSPPRRKRSAMRRLTASNLQATRSTSSASVPGASMLLARRVLPGPSRAS